MLRRVFFTGMLISISTCSYAQKAPAPEDVLTPGARLVVGESTDEDFAILRPGEQEVKTVTNTLLPHKDTPGVDPSKNGLPLDKSHKHLFVQQAQAPAPAPAATTPKPAAPVTKPTAKRKVKSNHAFAFNQKKKPKKHLIQAQKKKPGQSRAVARAASGGRIDQRTLRIAQEQIDDLLERIDLE